MSPITLSERAREECHAFQTKTCIPNASKGSSFGWGRYNILPKSKPRFIPEGHFGIFSLLSPTMVKRSLSYSFPWSLPQTSSLRARRIPFRINLTLTKVFKESFSSSPSWNQPPLLFSSKNDWGQLETSHQTRGNSSPLKPLFLIKPFSKEDPHTSTQKAIGRYRLAQSYGIQSGIHLVRSEGKSFRLGFLVLPLQHYDSPLHPSLSWTEIRIP